MSAISAIEDHASRRRQIVAAHPGVRYLIGPCQATAIWIVPAAAIQVAMAIALAGQPWWLVLLAAYVVGGFAMHVLNVVIHECSHDLVFRRSGANKACAIVANLPAGLPTAMAFRHYHLLHHRFLGEPSRDADVPPDWETRLIGRSRLGKLVWLLLQPLTYAVLHPLRVAPNIRCDVWVAANIVSALGVAAAVGWFLGPAALGYLWLSAYFAVGLHPTGAHILQEHLNFSGHYETASYYGPVNRISINHGYHLEHHDFPGVAGPRLPALRREATEYYDTRFFHRSRIATLWQFVFDREIGIDSRIVRGGDAR